MHAIYNPVSTYTPSEREAVIARRARLQRIAGRAVADTPIILRAQTAENVPEPAPQLSWEEKQKHLHQKIKTPWFSIVGDSGPTEPRRPSLEQIRRAVGQYYGFSQTILIAQRRTAPVVHARQVAMYLAKTLSLRSLPEIGRRFGNRDHTTVLHAVRKIEALIKTEGSVGAEIEAITAELRA